MRIGAPMAPKCMGKSSGAAGATSKSAGSQTRRGCCGGTCGSSMTEPFMRFPQGGSSAKGSSGSPGGSGPRAGCVMMGSTGSKPGLMMHAVWGELLAALPAACGGCGSGQHGGGCHGRLPAHSNCQHPVGTAARPLGKQCRPAPRQLPRRPPQSPTRLGLWMPRSPATLGPRMPQWRPMPPTRGLTTLSSFGLPSAAARGGETSSLVACGACFLKLNGALKLDLSPIQAAKKTKFPGPALPGTRLSDVNGPDGRQMQGKPCPRCSKCRVSPAPAAPNAR